MRFFFRKKNKSIVSRYIYPIKPSMEIVISEVELFLTSVLLIKIQSLQKTGHITRRAETRGSTFYLLLITGWSANCKNKKCISCYFRAPDWENPYFTRKPEEQKHKEVNVTYSWYFCFICQIIKNNTFTSSYFCGLSNWVPCN